jgi:hypothetical protein
VKDKGVRVGESDHGVTIKEYEYFLSVHANTIIYPRAVVVHQHHTSLASIAVKHIRRLDRVTSDTVPLQHFINSKLSGYFGRLRLFRFLLGHRN